MSNAPSEFIPNSREITLDRKCARIDRECAKRIQAHFGMQEQIFALYSALSTLIGYAPSADIVGVSSESYIASRDKETAANIARCIMAHRAAADALKVYCSRNIAQINSIDVSAPRFWPPAPKGPKNED
jgi:hypothetical protein